MLLPIMLPNPAIRKSTSAPSASHTNAANELEAAGNFASSFAGGPQESHTGLLRALWLPATSPCWAVNFATFNPSFPEFSASPLGAALLGKKERQQT